MPSKSFSLRSLQIHPARGDKNYKEGRKALKGAWRQLTVLDIWEHGVQADDAKVCVGVLDRVDAVCGNSRAGSDPWSPEIVKLRVEPAVFVGLGWTIQY